MKTALAILLGGFSAVAAMAADLPELILPQGVGVNIHFVRGHEKDLDLIAAAGFKFIRMDFGWGGIERNKGEYRWTEYDELTANLDKRGLRAIYILDYSNGLYEEAVTSKDPVTGTEHRDTASPQHPESVAAFAKWAAAAAEHFKGRRIVWEIWNEPNIGFWKPKPDAKQYTALALATCKALRAADPQATIIAPASSEFPWDFLEHFFQNGALDYLDAVSVHPYRSYSRPPETAGVEYRRLRALIARHAPAAKKNLPIISGEWGYATHNKGVSLQAQAAFIARQQIANVLDGIPISIWYDWKNDGSDTNYNEHNFGTVYPDLKPKPAYTAVQTLSHELGGYRIARRLAGFGTEDFVVLCVSQSGDQKLAAWTLGPPHVIAVDVESNSANDVLIRDGLGQSRPVELSQGKLALNLQAQPQYVTLHRPVRSWSAAAAWQVTPGHNVVVEAGKRDAFRLLVKVKNPFSFPVRLLVTEQVLEASSPQPAAFPLAPGKTHGKSGQTSQPNGPSIHWTVATDVSRL